MTKVAVLAAALLTAGVAANALTAQAAPDFKTLFQSGTINSSQKSAAFFPIPKHVEDPGAGRYTTMLEAPAPSAGQAKSTAPAHMSKQQVGERTNVLPPPSNLADDRVGTATKPWLAQAEGANNPLTIDSREYSSKLHFKELAKIDSDVGRAAPMKTAARRILRVKLADTDSCNALDAKLDKRHMPFKQELARLNQHECLVGTTI